MIQYTHDIVPVIAKISTMTTATTSFILFKLELTDFHEKFEICVPSGTRLRRCLEELSKATIAA